MFFSFEFLVQGNAQVYDRIAVRYELSVHPDPFGALLVPTGKHDSNRFLRVEAKTT